MLCPRGFHGRNHTAPSPPNALGRRIGPERRSLLSFFEGVDRERKLLLHSLETMQLKN